MVRSTQPRFGIVAQPYHESPGYEPGAHVSRPGHDDARGDYRTPFDARFDARSDVGAVEPMGCG
jgi:hypothetical protein